MDSCGSASTTHCTISSTRVSVLKLPCGTSTGFWPNSGILWDTSFPTQPELRLLCNVCGTRKEDNPRTIQTSLKISYRPGHYGRRRYTVVHSCHTLCYPGAVTSVTWTVVIAAGPSTSSVMRLNVRMALWRNCVQTVVKDKFKLH